jgi:hypothetical protein
VTVSGGKFDREDRYIAPTIVTDIAENSPLLTDEIFGPILPVLPFTNREALIEKLRRGPVPLALYLFTKNKRLQRHCLAQVRSGTACINETFLQVTSAHLPFGGVGDSGMGSYHGKAGFDSFTHYRSILEAGFTFRGDRVPGVTVRVYHAPGAGCLPTPCGGLYEDIPLYVLMDCVAAKTVTADPDGFFRIEGVPAGHERIITAEQALWQNGDEKKLFCHHRIDVEPGVNWLGIMGRVE